MDLTLRARTQFSRTIEFILRACMEFQKSIDTTHIYELIHAYLRVCDDSN